MLQAVQAATAWGLGSLILHLRPKASPYIRSLCRASPRLFPKPNLGVTTCHPDAGGKCSQRGSCGDRQQYRPCSRHSCWNWRTQHDLNQFVECSETKAKIATLDRQDQLRILYPKHWIFHDFSSSDVNGTKPDQTSTSSTGTQFSSNAHWGIHSETISKLDALAASEASECRHATMIKAFKRILGCRWIANIDNADCMQTETHTFVESQS